MDSNIEIIGFINNEETGEIEAPCSDEEWAQLLEDMPWIKEEELEDIPVSQWVIEIKS